MADELPPPYTPHDPNETSSQPAPSFDDAVAGPSTAVPAAVYSEALSLENLESGTSFASRSGREYFKIRPPKVSRSVPIYAYVLTIKPAATPENLKHPGKQFKERDVNEYDWMTFLNHCFLDETLSGLRDIPPVVMEKGKVVSLGSSIVSKRVPTNAIEDAERRVKIVNVVDEWNKGFFLPRGIKVRPEVARTPNLLKPTEVPIDAKPAGGETALYKAIKAGNVETTRLLLSKGADPNNYSMGSQSALYTACEKACDNPGWFWTSKGSKEHREILYLLLAHGANVNSKPSGSGSALHFAAKRGEAKLVSLLAKWGADPDRKPSCQKSALYEATGRGELELARLLLQEGANPDDTPSGNCSALEQSVKRGERAVFDLLIDYGAGVEGGWATTSSPVLVAVERDEVEMLRILLSRGADPNRCGTGRDTALYEAVSRDKPNIARTLLEWGADPVKQRWGGETALAAAVGRGNLALVQEMLKERPGRTDPARQQALRAQARQAAQEKGHLQGDLL